MKKIMWTLSAFIILINFSYAKSFSDVNNNYWASNMINEWTNNGIMSGYTDGSFRPNGEVTKAELVVILNKINNDEQFINKRPSKDIKISDWYCVDMAVALKNGLIELDSKGNLNPQALVTREEAITMVAKLFNLKYSGNSIGVLTRFNDSKSISIKNMPYVAGMVAEGYISGTAGKIKPTDNITRAELVSILNNVVEKICTNGKISNQSIKGNLIINGDNVSLSNVQVDGYIYLLKGAKDGNISFNNVYASKGIESDYKNVITYNDGTKKHDNLSNIEEVRPNAQVQFVRIDYSETDWTNKSVTATLKFDNKDMEIINNNGKNKYKFTKNGEFTFVCVDANGNEYRYTAKVDKIAKKDLKMELDVKDNVKDATVTVNILANEAPIEEMYFIAGKKSIDETLNNGTKIDNNQFTITETDYYTVAIKDEAGNKIKSDFYWKNTSKYVIDVIQNVGGSVTPVSSEVPYRGSQTFKITANTNDGYDLLGVKLDGVLQNGIVITNNETTFTIADVTETHSIEGVFNLREYLVTVEQPLNGEIKPGTIDMEHGSSKMFEFIPDVGYEISKVILDNDEVRFDKIGDFGKFELMNVTGEHTIAAEFTKKKYSIIVQKPDTGKITYDNQGRDEVGADEPNKNTAEIKVEHGDALTLYIFPENGFDIIDVVIDNLSVGARSVYTFKDVQASHSLVAMFENSGAIETEKLGPYVYSAIYPDYTCVIYGFGEIYDFELSDRPFGDHTELIKEVTIRSGITNVGNSLFANCTSLEKINLPDTVTEFGSNTFRNCESLEKINIPKVMNIIEEGLFYNCKSLENIAIPDSVEYIEADAFNGCVNMQTVTILGELKEIGDRAFKNCKRLIQIEFPIGLLTIGEEALYGCKEFQALEIPRTVESIGINAFNNCSKLKVINFKSRTDITDLGRDWFPNGGDYREYIMSGDTYVVERESFEIEVGNPENGSITPSGVVKVGIVQNQEFTITPDRGYRIKNLIVDGNILPANSTYIFNSVDSTHTIDATFEARIYSISYELNGGILAAENPTTYTVEDTILLNNPTKHGYDFVGWECNGLTSPIVNFTNEIENKTYTAIWTPKIYNITYVNADGAVNPNPLTYTIETPNIVLADLTRTGYEFLGWKVLETDIPQKNITIPTGGTGDLNYIAAWSPEIYTITYNLNNGYFANTPIQTYTVESSSFTLVEPTRLGYIFTGWTGGGLANATYNVTIPTGSSGNREYFANWEIAWYEITYDLDGGTNATNNPAGYTILTPSIHLEAPTKAGHQFLGWIENGGSTVKYDVMIPIGSTGNRSFKAMWR